MSYTKDRNQKRLNQEKRSRSIHMMTKTGKADEFKKQLGLDQRARARMKQNQK